MNGIHCRTGDLTESGKHLHPIYGYICIVPPNLSTDIYSGRLLIHTNGIIQMDSKADIHK